MNKTFNITKTSLPYLSEWAAAHLELKGEYVLTYTTIEKAKTNAQNNTFHKLLDMYWKSGLSSYNSYDQMRNKFLIIAELVREYVYADENGVQSVKTKAEIPSNVSYKHCRVIVDSWANVTKKNAVKAIDALIKEMLSVGVASLEFDKMITEFNE